jgi:hypothetical protein
MLMSRPEKRKEEEQLPIEQLTKAHRSVPKSASLLEASARMLRERKKGVDENTRAFRGVYGRSGRLWNA